MSNMSYCRFQNTSLDLIDCRDAFQEFTECSGSPLSRDEIRAAAQLISSAAQLVQSFAYLAEVDVEAVAIAELSAIRKVLEQQNAVVENADVNSED